MPEPHLLEHVETVLLPFPQEKMYPLAELFVLGLDRTILVNLLRLAFVPPMIGKLVAVQHYPQ